MYIQFIENHTGTSRGRLPMCTFFLLLCIQIFKVGSVYTFQVTEEVKGCWLARQHVPQNPVFPGGEGCGEGLLLSSVHSLLSSDIQDRHLPVLFLPASEFTSTHRLHCFSETSPTDVASGDGISKHGRAGL